MSRRKRAEASQAHFRLRHYRRRNLQREGWHRSNPVASLVAIELDSEHSPHLNRRRQQTTAGFRSEWFERNICHSNPRHYPHGRLERTDTNRTRSPYPMPTVSSVHGQIPQSCSIHVENTMCTTAIDERRHRRILSRVQLRVPRSVFNIAIIDE